MELETISYFITVAECLNFSEAADIHHISQSSFSKAIMRLEKDLGVRLLDRTKHPIQLTEAGRVWYRDMCALRPQFREALRHQEAFRERRRLRVLGCPKSYAYRNAIRDYQEAHPQDLIEYDQTSEYDTLVQQMLDGGYDLAVAPKPLMLPPTLKMTCLYTDVPYLIVSSSSPLAEKESVSFQDMEGLTFCESPFSWYLLRELMRCFSFTPSRIEPDEEGTRTHLVKREEVFHRIIRGKAVSLYCGRDVFMFRDQEICALPINELPELPVVLLEKAGARQTPEKTAFREWITASLESYVCPLLK